MKTIAGFLRKLRQRNDGVSAVEFAVLAPILLFILAATLDFGMVLYARFNLNEAVSASINYAMVSATNVSFMNGASLATSLAAIIPSAFGANVVINNGPATQRTGGATTTSGTATNADLCYCPTLSGTAISWGSSATCASACSKGGVAGKFVAVTAIESYTPLFSNYGIVQSGIISISALAQVQ